MARLRDRRTWGGQHDEPTEIAHSSLRGVIAAMSMSGMRTLANRLGLLGSSPPEMVAEEELPRVMRTLNQPSRDTLVIVMHWGYGGMGGAAFGALPGTLRLRRWSGPAFGLLLWGIFESLIGPTLGLRRLSMRERLVLAVDHAQYGAVLSELRTKPRR
jgi:hypothetical protein